MNTSRMLGLVMIAPAAIMILLFFLMPVVLTGVFSMTNMTTATGISGGAYQIAPHSLNDLKSSMPEIVEQLSQPRYTIDEAGLTAVEGLRLDPALVAELRAKHMGEVFQSRREVERMIKGLDQRPLTPDVKRISEQLNRSVVNSRFSGKEELFSALNALGFKLTDAQKTSVADATYTGWGWTTENFSRIASSPDMVVVLFNTLVYVALVLVLFNTTYAMLLAIWTHYMPSAPATIFRSIWLLPRITPVVRRFLWETPAGRPNIWLVTLNTLIFTASVTTVILLVSSMAGYVLSRLNVPARGFFLAGVMVLHAFPSVTLIIAIFIVLQLIGLYNSLIGVILVKAAIDLPLGIWLMKGFYDTVPWEIEMAGVVDGASRFRVWHSLVLPQVRPAVMALGLFSFLSGWGEFILPQVLAPGSNVQVLSVYLSALIADDNNFDFGTFKAVGVFYVIPVLIVYTLFHKYLMNIYGGGSKG